jgi:hypothetical protein
LDSHKERGERREERGERRKERGERRKERGERRQETGDRRQLRLRRPVFRWGGQDRRSLRCQTEDRDKRKKWTTEVRNW